ncbi:MAG: hypothetical protein OEM79_03635 [Nitrosopumilus sp.]|nr:hypothetical protein [Nitrosopumilus sp.]
MGWKNRFTSTPLLVLFIVLVSIGVGTASALITITLSGDVIITGGLDMTSDKITNVGVPTENADAATKGYVDSSPATDTLALLGCTIDQIAKYDGNNWVCVSDDDTLTSIGCSVNELAQFDGNNWVCVKLVVKNNPISIIDNTGIVGLYTSVAIGADDNPVISYYDETTQDLKVVHCGNTLCSTGNTITTVDSTDNVGQYTSMAIGADDNPVISYYYLPGGDLKVVHCGNTLCSTGNTITTVDSTGSVGIYSSIAIGSDNNPVISYTDQSLGDLKFVHCGNTSCSSGNNVITLDSANVTGTFTSMAIGADGNPVISFFDSTNSDLKVVHCGDTICSSGNSITTVDSNDDVGLYTSIAIGVDGNPVISYYAKAPNFDLKVVHCGDISCSTGNIINTIDSTGIVGWNTSIAIGPDNNPVISYYDSTNDDLKVVHCGDISCSTGNTIEILDSDGLVGDYTSIAIGSDSNPVISYYDETNGNLKSIVDGKVVTFE